MKGHLSSLDPVELAKEFPLANRMPNWFFRVSEMSAGAYQAEGISVWGNRVATQDTNPDRAVDRCVAMAQGIARTIA
jgi:hypothetical protein